jgi:hypothetical protein
MTGENMSEQVAIRNEIKLRYDLLDFNFIEAMAKIAHYGVITYGEGNWRKSRLVRDKSPINHIIKHVKQFLGKEEYDHPEIGKGYKMQLAAIAFNAMMEFYYVEKEEKVEKE